MTDQADRATAEALMQSGRWQEAAEAWASVADACPDDVTPVLKEMRCRAEFGGHGENLSITRAARLRWPTEPRLLAREARSLLRLGRVDEALALRPELLRLAPKHAVLDLLDTAAADKARAAALITEERALAEAEIQRLAEEARLRAAEFAAEEAASEVRARSKRKVQAHIAEAKRLTRAGNWPAATTAWEEACSLKPDSVAPVVQYLRCLTELGRHETIVAVARTAREHWPEEAKIVSRLIKSLIRLDRINEARALREDLALLNPSDGALTMLNAAEIAAVEGEARRLMAAGHWAEAHAAWSEIRMQYPGSVTPFAEGLACLTQMGETPRVVEMAREARSHWPEAPELLTAELRALLRLGRLDEAAALRSEIRRIDPTNRVLAALDAEAACADATALSRRKDWRSAFEAWDKASAAAAD